MADSQKIIAINNDPEAPIFNVAHYKIVGDLNQVVPMMIKAIREKV
jgi:electron transfer flavoprotein alpha subunit